jgi:hypothetical protein
MDATTRPLDPDRRALAQALVRLLAAVWLQRQRTQP